MSTSWQLVRPEPGVRWRLVLALVLGVAAAGSAVALLATSAWLITAASAQPPILLLLVPIVAVRAFGVGRGVFRYVERLVGHDAAYRVLGETRARIRRTTSSANRIRRSGSPPQSSVRRFANGDRNCPTR